MSGKELSKLVAFVKGTQFDLVVSFTVLFGINLVSSTITLSLSSSKTYCRSTFNEKGTGVLVWMILLQALS